MTVENNQESIEKKAKDAFLRCDKAAWDDIDFNSWGGICTISSLEVGDKDYSNWNFSKITFKNCKFTGCNFTGCNFKSVTFSQSIFELCDFDQSIFKTIENQGVCNISDTSLFNCSMNGVQMFGAVVSRNKFTKCSFNKSKFFNVVFDFDSFSESNLSEALFNLCSFREETIWEKSTFSHATSFFRSRFREDTYNILNDQSDEIGFTGFVDRCLRWKYIQFLSNFPLFGVSWTTFIGSVIFVNYIQLLNDSKFIEGLNYPVPIPASMIWIIISSILLAFSSTIYKWKCPEIVQNFTESQWVYEHRHARPIYIVQTLSHPVWRISAFTLMALGSLIAVILIFDRVSSAIFHAW